MKVLIVEDEPRFAATLSMGLRAEGFVVVHADNGLDGLWEATENTFDVIVLDIMLPGEWLRGTAKAASSGGVDTGLDVDGEGW